MAKKHARIVGGMMDESQMKKGKGPSRPRGPHPPPTYKKGNVAGVRGFAKIKRKRRVPGQNLKGK
jgi:hypothetical protein